MFDGKLKEIANDTNHWHQFGPPLSPNKYEVELFEQFSKDYKPICLLGLTKPIAHLCDFAIDINPIVDIGKPTIKKNWMELKDMKVGAIIGDGILNLVEFPFLEIAKPICQRFICRVFQEKLPGMKYATFFPQEFPYNPILIQTQPNITIAIWDF